jgi:TRAP-type C4-dicarboxylate transport system permease small subunit
MSGVSTKISAIASKVVIALGALLAFAVILSCLNVVGRYVFARSIDGAEEIQIFILVWCTFIGAAVVSWRNAQLRMDLLVQSLSAGLASRVRYFESALTCLVTGIAAWQAIQYVKLALLLDRRSEVADIPMALPHAGIAIGLALISLSAALRLLGIDGYQRPQPIGAPRERER